MMPRFEHAEQAAGWLRQHVRGQLQADSRQLNAGDGFLAWPGRRHDARDDVPAALQQGVAACLLEAQDLHWPQESLSASPMVASMPHLKSQAGAVASAFYACPSARMHVVAVTGTNGKTSTTWWLAAALNALQMPGLSPCAVMGSLGWGLPANLSEARLTTPDAVTLQGHLHHGLQQGIRVCAMEASSIGLVEQRLNGTRIEVAVFTNFTQDHLDYHGNMQAYWQAKRSLFDWPGLRVAVIDIDDPKGRELAAQLEQKELDVWTCSRQGEARVAAVNLRQSAAGWQVDVRADGQQAAVNMVLPAPYAVSNLLAVVATLRALDVSLAQAAMACSNLPPVPGRMERIEFVDKALAFVDFSHTPDALQNALQSLRPLAQARGGRLWCVFGCGGDRDAGKRPLMAAVAENWADQLVLTSDNPRSENPQAIIDAMRAGLSRPDQVWQEVDRGQAIARSLQAARSQDVVLIAGRGNETHQETGGRRLPFSDREHVLQALRQQTLEQTS